LLDFSDVFALLSHLQNQMQDNTNTVAWTKHPQREKQDRPSQRHQRYMNPTLLDGQASEEVDNFIYLGIIMEKTVEQRLM
jgi:hypothetical protein